MSLLGLGVLVAAEPQTLQPRQPPELAWSASSAPPSVHPRTIAEPPWLNKSRATLARVVKAALAELQAHPLPARFDDWWTPSNGPEGANASVALLDGATPGDAPAPVRRLAGVRVMGLGKRPNHAAALEASPAPDPPAAVGGAEPVGEGWCPDSCPVVLTPNAPAPTAGVIGVASRNPAKQLDLGEAARCDLCAKPYLFVVSIGGRTGSTTVLNMLNAHPALRLAGENGGMMRSVTDLLHQAGISTYGPMPSPGPSPAKEMDPWQYGMDSGAWQRGVVRPSDALCDVQRWFDDVAPAVEPSAAATVVRGFKDVAWTADSLQALQDTFPCSRIVYNVNNNATDHMEGYMKAFHKDLSAAMAAVEDDRRLLASIKTSESGSNGAQSFWLPLQDFTAEKFNELLAWLGETGCTYTGVIHSNSGPGGYGMAGATREDAKQLLVGECNLFA